MNPITDYDLRQLDRMTKIIDAFLVDEVSLHDLVATLSFLLDHVQDVSLNWKSIFQDEWMLLEIINADVSEQRRKLTNDERQYVLEKAKNLSFLLQEVTRQ